MVISHVLNVLAEAPNSQDLPAVYALIGSQLADAGRQDAKKSHITDIARECARREASPETAWNKAVEESAVTLALARLHTEGLRADEKDVQRAVREEIQHIWTEWKQGKLKAKAKHFKGPK
jgi:hypothetical protein